MRPKVVPSPLEKRRGQGNAYVLNREIIHESRTSMNLFQIEEKREQKKKDTSKGGIYHEKKRN